MEEIIIRNGIDMVELAVDFLNLSTINQIDIGFQLNIITTDEFNNLSNDDLRKEIFVRAYVKDKLSDLAVEVDVAYGILGDVQV